MSGFSLSRLCTDNNDPMMHMEVRCKHGHLLPLQTSWSERNPGRRFWSCPLYGDGSCKFFRWRDNEVDDRSKFVITRMVKKMKEMQNKVAIYEKEDGAESSMPTLMQASVDEKEDVVESSMPTVDEGKVQSKEKRWWSFNWKIVIILVVLAVIMHNQLKQEHCKCSQLQLP